MVFDSHSTKSPSSIVGTSAFGLRARYSGVRVNPNAAPASMRSNGNSRSCAVNTTLRTLIDDRRPQIFSMFAPCAEAQVLPSRARATDAAKTLLPIVDAPCCRRGAAARARVDQHSAKHAYDQLGVFLDWPLRYPGDQ